MRRISLLAVIISTFVLNAGIMSAQETINGYKLIEKKFVKEVNSDCYYYEHLKTGARIFKISNDDANKTFCISFKTVPYSDNGIAHIMEHSVLNGSKKYPVKSPFDVLSKGSLNTFMNAFTSRDATSYPFASMNEKDYFNMMDVYLDAVFNPLIYTDTRILKQEGWHYELQALDQPVIYKGVVYNEMKGAFSNPQRENLYQILKSIFPDNVYGYESGGMHGAITSLTQDEFVAFHKKFYHPSNSYIFLYGDGDTKKELEYLDREYLSKFERSTEKIEIPDQKPFVKMKEQHEYYPVLEGSQTDNQSYLSMNFVMGRNSDNIYDIALNLLCEVLVNQESAPVRLALQKAGVGQDVSAFVLDYKQSGISIVVQNANASDSQKCREIILNSLKEVAKNGINKTDLEGVLNRVEFGLREGSNAQKGVSYQAQVLPGWFFAENPFAGLEYEKHLKVIREWIAKGQFEKIIEKDMINNPHSSFLCLEPKPGLDKIRNDATLKELEAYKEKLSDKAKEELVKETQTLIAFQNSEDSPEALATIPMLSLSDINSKTDYFGCREHVVDNTKVLQYEGFSNGVVYASLMFDMSVLPQDLIPYAALLSNIALMMNTANYSYASLNQELNLQTGGFTSSVTSYQKNNDPNNIQPFYIVSGKVMNSKTDKFFDLSLEILKNLKFDDPERLKEIIARHQSQMESSFNREGFQVAFRRLQSYINSQGAFNEATQGIDYFRFVTDLSSAFDKKSSEISEKLRKTAELLFTKSNLTATVTCDKNDMEKFNTSLSKFIPSLPGTPVIKQNWNFNLENRKEAILTASKVQYVMSGYNLKKLGQDWDGKLLVLNQVLSTDFLYNQIRVIGGAYGGFSRLLNDGTMIFGSYRDPNLKITLDVYEKAGEYVSAFQSDEAGMTRFIIGTIATMDAPLTMQQKGATAVRNYFTGRTALAQQQEREAVLSTKPEDIRKFGKIIKDLAAQKYICVYGNTDKIQSEKDVFLSLIKIRIDG